MKLSLDIKKKELSLHADVEKLVDKQLDKKTARPPKKSRYQIKQEEKRKNKELEMKQTLIYIAMMLGVVVAALIICSIGSLLS